MKNDNNSPIYEAQTRARYGHEATLRIHNLEGLAEIVISSEDGEKLVVPSQFLEALSSVSSMAISEIHDAIDTLRRKENHPFKVEKGLTPLIRRGRWSSNQDEFGHKTTDRPSYDPAKATILCLAGTDPNEDGTPYIEWAYDEETREHGWRLRISGVPNVNLSWSAWDDMSGITDAVKMLADAEACQVIAGVVNPSATAQMTSRVAARALRSGRKLPGINMPKVRKVFSEHADVLLPTPVGNSEDLPYYYRSRTSPEAKIFSVPSGDKKVPVAVAIIPPAVFANQKMLSEDEARSLTYKQRQEREETAYQAELEPWQEKVLESFAMEGWRSVSMPKPRHAWGLNYQNVQWFTLLNEEQWSTVAPAARHFASSEFSLSRTTRIS